LKDSLAKDGVQVVTIGIQDDPASLENALRNSGASFPLYIDKEGQVASRFKIAGVPETFLLNAEGKFVLFDDPTQGPTIRLMGPRDWDDPSFIRRIRAALTK
jgi:peroxiredoxin